MSALFKLVLGQSVVHPDAAKPKTSDNPQATGEAALFHGSSSQAAVSESKLSPALQKDNQQHASPNPGRTVSSAQDGEAPGSGVPPLKGTAPALKTAVSSSPPLRTQKSASLLVSSSTSLRPSTPTRTLLLRIEGCIVAQDIRDALRDLLRCADLPYALDEGSVRSLFRLLTNYSEDESITEPTLHLLVNATDIDAYPSQLESRRGTTEVTMADKRHTRDELLQALQDAASLLLEAVNATAPFWSRYYAIILLQRLEEYEPSKVSQALLAAHGVGVLLDALNETEHDNLLRNEALVLLTSLTLADRELQTLLAFDNAFDSLFDLVQREGGVLGGGTVVRDCLTVVHNILRSNKATQKFFREMGCAARLAALFDSIPAELAECAAEDQRSGNASPTQRHWPRPSVALEALEALLGRVKNQDVVLNVLMSVSILACVLRGHEESEEDLHATQDALLRCGLLNPLTRLAFSGQAIDDATRIEAVRVLALLLDRSKRAVEEWLASPQVVTLVQATQPYTVRAWSAPRALLSYLCETSDATLVNAGVQLFLSALSVPTCHERVVGVFLEGLVGASADEAGTQPASAATSRAKAAKASPVNHPNGSASNGAGYAQSDSQCGSALARILLSSATSAAEKYYSAQVFRTLISLPAAARLSELLVRVALPAELQQSKLDALVKSQPGWTLSAKLAPSFFNYFVSFLLFAISGGAASQQMNTSALGAYVAALLAWTGACPWAAAALVQEVSWGDVLLHQARRDGAAPLRLWSAVIIAQSCVVVGAAVGAAPGKSTLSVMEKAAAAACTALAQRFLQMVGGSAALDTILFDAQASTPTWQHPAADGLRAQTPTVYDEPFVTQVEQLVGEFKQLLSTVVGPPMSKRPSTVSLPAHANLAPQAVTPAAPTYASPPTSPYSSPKSLYPAPPYSSPRSDAQPQQVSPPLHEHSQDQQQYVITSSPPSLAPPSADFQLPRTSVGPHAVPPPPPPPPAVANGSAPAVRAEPSAETLAVIESLQAQLQAAQAERENTMLAVEKWRERAEQSEARCLALQKEQEERAAAVTAAEADSANQREAAAAVAQASAVSSDVVDGLREHVRLLEEALNSKDEEQQQLVASLNMMEEQLRHAANAAAVANEQRAAAVAAAAQHPVPPPQGPPPQPQQQQGLPPEVVASLEAERNALEQRLAEMRQEAGCLQRSYENLRSDYQELLVMVAELNEECVSVKAFSSMAPTPARRLANSPSASPLADREYEVSSCGDEGAESARYQMMYPQTVAMGPTVAAVATHRDEIPTSSAAVLDRAKRSESSPSMRSEGQWKAVQSPSTQLAEIARTASAASYAEATDVLVCSTASQSSSLPMPVSEQRNIHSHHQQRQVLDSRTSSQRGPSPHDVQPPPPNSAPFFQATSAHECDGLQNPSSGRRSAPDYGSQNEPHPADPSMDVFNVGASVRTQVPDAIPPPSAPVLEVVSKLSSRLSNPTQGSSPVYHDDTPPPFACSHGLEHNGDSKPLLNADSRAADRQFNHQMPPQPALPVQKQPWQSCTHHETQGVEQHICPTEILGDGSSCIQTSPQLSSAECEAQAGAQPLLSADDFFGGGGDDEAAGSMMTGHAVLPVGTADGTSSADPSLPADEHQAQPRPPPLPHGEASAPDAAVTMNPFLLSSSSVHSEHASAHAFAASSNKTANSTMGNHFSHLIPSSASHPVPMPPSNEQKGGRDSLSVKRDSSHTGALLPRPPQPPLPPPGHKHPASALVGGAHHLNYRGNALEGRQLPNQQVPPAAVRSGNGCVPSIAPTASATTTATQPHVALNTSLAQETAPYNPFADFQGDGDDDDGFADLR
ncbi:hypothetical protein ABL78_0647 [Leptomonas seymouri]|uniref:Vesicle tethering protein Uso1/P115-like head domain-containing protein n=1 Tax=Leptomonas seymouri TaxID=5684 RepID=A0A0N1I1T9_LEPSE|nr:hypothetical protein ABL78_0647 [Leptomonas seymouri]|eukprot:KPI90265.1 hypothetical protein ABL78_0647 [Leptomonas seymouri]